MVFKTMRNDYRIKYMWDWDKRDDDGAPAPDVVMLHLWQRTFDGAEIDELEDIVCLRDLLSDMTPAIVRRAREQNCSWKEIGDALGMSRQAAQQRFGDQPTRSTGRLGKG